MLCYFILLQQERQEGNYIVATIFNFKFPTDFLCKSSNIFLVTRPEGYMQSLDYDN